MSNVWLDLTDVTLADEDTKSKLTLHTAFHFYRTQVSLVRSMGLVVSHSLTHSLTDLANLTDVTLADEDTNSILTDNAKRAIQGNVAMQVTQPGGKICK